MAMTATWKHWLPILTVALHYLSLELFISPIDPFPFSSSPHRASPIAHSFHRLVVSFYTLTHHTHSHTHAHIHKHTLSPPNHHPFFPLYFLFAKSRCSGWLSPQSSSALFSPPPSSTSPILHTPYRHLDLTALATRRRVSGRPTSPSGPLVSLVHRTGRRSSTSLTDESNCLARGSSTWRPPTTTHSTWPRGCDPSNSSAWLRVQRRVA